MDMMAIIRQSWSLTRQRWELWLLNLAMMLVFTPALLLVAAFGGLAAFIVQPFAYPLPAAFRWVENLESGEWAWLGLVGVLLLASTTVLAIWFQAAAIRLVVYASQGKAAGLAEALRFSRRQMFRMMGLGGGFGLMNGILALLPLVVPMFFDGASRAGVMRLMQAVFSPAGTVLGVVLLLLLISIAVDDLIPATATHNFGKIIREGWGGFLIVMALTLVLGTITVAALVIPLVPLLVVGIVLPDFILLLAPCLGIVVIISVILSLAGTVFTLTMYTLVYRAAAGLAELNAQPAVR